MFSCKFAAYFQFTSSWEHFWMVTSERIINWTLKTTPIVIIDFYCLHKTIFSLIWGSWVFYSFSWSFYSCHWRTTFTYRRIKTTNGCYYKLPNVYHTPASIYLLKVNNRNIRKSRETCSKFTVKTPEQRQWR